MRLPRVQARLTRYYMKRLSALCLILLFAAPLLPSQTQTNTAGTTATTPSDTVVEEIVARVNNNIITRADMRKAREQLYAEARQQTDQVAADQDAKEHEKDLLRDLIDQQLAAGKGTGTGYHRRHRTGEAAG